MSTKIFESYYDFCNREDKKVNGVTKSFADTNPYYEKQNKTNEGCWNCRDCRGCRGINNTNKSVGFSVPVIENIHQRVLEAIQNPGNSLEMDTWHTCDTTHCRAGWVTTLAGKEGKELEDKTSTAFAAMQIYKASSPVRVSPTRFYEDNVKAMEDIQRCADEEIKLNENGKQN